MNQKDINQIFAMLSKMDKKDLEMGIQKAQQILKSKDGEKLMQQFQNKDQSKNASGNSNHFGNHRFDPHS